MNKFYRYAAAIALAFLIFPLISFAGSLKTLSGTITGINGSQIIFSTTSAATYSAEVGNAALIRKNGATMQFTEFIVGDKVTVVGTLWSDNSISASSVRDMSLYAHTGTFSGKITALDPANSAFTLQSKTYGIQTIHTNNFTSFTKNGSSSTFKDLILGMTMTIKGSWDRTNTNIIATTAAGTYRLIDIYFTGSLSIKNGASLTVVGNGNVIYGVDISKATLQNKNSKPIAISALNYGDALRVWGKHISGSVQIVGIEIKDSSITK